MESEKSIVLLAKWQVKEGKLDDVLRLLPQLAEKSREEEGNLYYKVNQSQADANTIILFEAYKSEAAVAAHRASAHFQTIVIGQIVPMLEYREVTLATPLM
ncbi:putative quinol monooxygenase [Mucilaginibacter psychrotolerans]|uniref:Antibiotic biosynthesis monooxygenase n=1 Tax=Mucilaginibacter psychrotolerans TaxID=1524096 RepID=A0A4Y8S7A4_9SPHI|nr:antibiotic biosynthesis monooxygenase [Mucilaginibacter psychrotolerans]TFF34491.1 antibiotic biosynthesis monooxygenase [Mucilaginibacter psychrotolerans]